MHLLWRWALNAVALWLTVELDIGASLAGDSLGTLLITALVLGLVNAVLRPVLILVTLPLTFVTFGAFLLVVNALSLAVVAAVTPLELAGFGGAVLAALVVTVIASLLARVAPPTAPRR